MAGLQTVTTPVTATTISSTTFGIPVANNLTVLANPPLARLRNSVGQTITTATATALTWDTEDLDTVSGHSTTTNTSRYTCQSGYAGTYRAQATVYYAANATGIREVWFSVNGSFVDGTAMIVTAAASGATSVSTEAFLTLAVGDYIEAITQQTSGGNLATSVNARSQSRLEIQWIHA